MDADDTEIASLKPSDKSSDEVIDTAVPCSYSDLFKYTDWRTRLYFVIAIVHSIADAGLCVLLLITIQQIYDEGTDEEEDDYDVYHEIRKIALIQYTFGVMILYTGFVGYYCFMRVSFAVGISIRRVYFKAITHKDLAYFDNINSTEVPTRLGRDCELIEGGTGEKFMSFVEVGSFCLFAILFGLIESAQTFLVGFAIIPLGVLGNGLFGVSVILGSQIKERTYLKAGAITEESLTEIKTVSAYNAQDYMSKRYNTEMEKSISMMSLLSTLRGVGSGLGFSTWIASAAVMFWSCSKWISDEKTNWVKRDEMEGPDVIVNYWICGWLAAYIGQLAPAVQAVIESRKAGGRAFKLIDEPNSFVNGRQQVDISGEVELRNVHFAYPKHPDKQILCGLTFLCHQGEKTAIVGESGAGKSTIIQLMERFYEPDAGEVLYDGIPVKDLDIGYLRRQIGYVSQEPILFNMTIAENILIGYPEGTSADIEAAAKEANAYNFVMSLPDKFETDVGLKGSKLSGGQKQRIAIARAVIKKPKILFLDEATSALDNESEALVLRALNAIHEHSGLTMISVAQKLSTIRGSHKIIVLRDGRVEEQGSHEDLIHRQGLYAQMCTAQGSFIEEVKLDSEAVTSAQSNGDVVSPDSSVVIPPSDFQVMQQYPVLRIFKSMLPYWPLLTVGLISGIIAGCMFPLTGFFAVKLSEFITGLAGQHMEYEIRKYAIWALGFSGLVLLTHSLSGWSFGVVNSRLVRNLRRQGFQSLLHYDSKYFDESEHNANMLAYNLNADSEKANDSGGPLFKVIIVMVSAYIATVILAFHYQWKLALLNVFLIPIESFCLTRTWFIRAVGVLHPDHQNAAMLTQDTVMNIKTVKSYQAQDQIQAKYEVYLDRAFNGLAEEQKWSGLSYGIGYTAIFGGLATSLWYGAYLQKYDEASDVDANMVGFAALTAAVGMATTALFAPGFAEGARAAGRIFGIIDYKPVIDASSDEGNTAPIQGTIKLENVSFKYAGRDNLVLKNVSFDLPAGKHFAITGASGSGKTTLTQLLLRFYDPIEGQIYIDGVDIRQWHIKHLRANIALVSQEPVLFSGPVRANVDFGLGKSDEDIKEALRQASIPKFADELDRDVGTRGSAVSGGQKQRIAIARAILRNPRILLLDEATSALDSKTEKKILEALEQASLGRTVLVVAHRLSTIERSDQILVMDLGEIKERGTHQELSSREGSIYQSLLRASKASDLLHI